MSGTPPLVVFPQLNRQRLVLADIGARYGIHPRWNRIASQLTVYAFEPDGDECDRINATAASLPYQLHCLPCALSDEERHGVPLYLCEDPGCSSLYRPNVELARQFYFGPRMEVTTSLPVSVTRFDAVCMQHGIRPDAIKIDTQGYELNILKGAGALLHTVKLVEVEVEFNHQYENQPLFCDVDRFMREQGFSLLGLRRSYWRRKVEHADLRSPYGGQIMHGDAIYYNERWLTAAVATQGIDAVKFCILLSVYRQDDFLGFLLTHPHPALAKLSEPERLAIAAALLNRRPRVAALLSGMADVLRRKLWIPHALLRERLDRLQSRHAKDWHDPEFF